MTEYAAHVPGTFCWPELATSDRPGAAAFYGSLFGWQAVDHPAGPGETYTMFQLRGHDVAAAYTLRADERQRGMPPRWNAYVSVVDADAAARRAQELGGTVLAPPFDVMDAGRMAVLQDPAGAVVAVWQPKRHIGARLLREPGALGWTELVTRDTAAAERFYTRLFGWEAAQGATGATGYMEFKVAGQSHAGMMAIDPAWGEMRPCWIPYFEVADCDAAVRKAESLGGRVNVPPTDLAGVGRFAMLADPQGALFYVIKITSR
jgi:predicted enzyme related to lactoylglutathione lyase